MILCRLRPLLDYWDNYYSPWVVVRTGCMGKLTLMQRRLYRLKWFGKCRNGRFSVISAGTRSVNEPWKINATSETENIYTYSLCFYKLWVFIYLKWWFNRPKSASFWVKATFLFYSTDKIHWNHHRPLFSITGSLFYLFKNVIGTNCECSSI